MKDVRCTREDSTSLASNRLQKTIIKDTHCASKEGKSVETLRMISRRTIRAEGDELLVQSTVDRTLLRRWLF